MIRYHIREFSRLKGLLNARNFCQRAAAGSLDYSHVVVGGGVVGLGIAAELSKVPSNRVLLLDKNERFGMETSSHNSEVIHAGIYYPPNSLKSKLCIEGKRIIYNELRQVKTGVTWLKCGKWIVAQTDLEDSVNERLYKRCKEELNVEVELLSSTKAAKFEPFINVQRSALSSPTSGIINSHSLIEYLTAVIQQNDGDMVHGSEVIGLEYSKNGGYTVTSKDKYSDNEEIVEVTAENVINSAGLYADQISNMLLPEDRTKRLYYAKGNYYKLRSGGFPPVNRLIYPVPPQDGKSLGTHLTIDMDHQILFGPDLEYVDSCADYTPNPHNIPAAFEAISRYYPHIDPTDLEAASCGIRPKLTAPGVKEFKDFYIKEEDGFPGFVNLLGIESPGLTASVAIGRYVRNIYHG